MKPIIFTIVLAIATAASAAESKSTQDITGLVGNWQGTSLCQVKPSPCHDENVVFRFSNPQGDKITVQADKIVEGKALTMGTGDWTYDKATQTLTWQIPRGTWKLVVNDDEMKGTLVVPDNVIFRKIDLRKQK